MRRFLVGVFATVAVAAPLRAQRLPERLERVEVSLASGLAPGRPAIDSGRRDVGIAAPLAGGVLFGVAGFFAGGVGLLDCRLSGLEDCGILEAYLGAAIGEAFLLPVGAHLFGNGRGSLLAKVAASVGIAALGVVMTGTSGSPAPLLLIPVAQLAAVVAIERSAR